MPLTQISVRKDMPPAEISAILDGIYDAMRETFMVPDDDRFMTVSEFENAGFSYGRRYPDVSRSDRFVIIQITVSNTRTTEQKIALYQSINEKISARANILPDDIFINIVEVLPENWSMGRGMATNLHI